MVTAKLLPHFMKDDLAASAVEYALLIGALSVVIGAVVQGLGIGLDGTSCAFRHPFMKAS